MTIVVWGDVVVVCPFTYVVDGAATRMPAIAAIAAIVSATVSLSICNHPIYGHMLLCYNT
jgi:hypothetical protein